MNVFPRAACLRSVLIASTFLFFGAAPALAGESAPSFQIPSPEERDRLISGGREAKDFAPPQRSEAEALLAASQDDYDVTNYFLDLDFDNVNRRVAGSVTITATSLIDDFQHMILDLTSLLAISSVRRGATPLTLTRSGSLVDVLLDAPVAPGQPVEITVTYSGVHFY